MSRVAVIGNTARAIGAVCASDLTLSGHEVRYAVFPEQKHQLPELRKAGGYTIEGDAQHLISKKTGFAKLDKICDTTAEALKNAEAVLIEVDPWKCGPSLADMDLEGSPEAVKKRVLGLR